MDLQDYLRLGRRYWRVIAAAVLVGLIGAWILAPDEPAAPGVSNRPVTSFEATHTLIRSSESIISGTGASAGASMNLLALLATTGEVPQRVAGRLGATDAVVLMGAVEAVGDNELGTLSITARDPDDGPRAAELANATAEELVSYLAENSAETQQQQIAQSGADLLELDQRIEALSQQISGDEDLVLVEQRSAFLRQYGVAFQRYEQLLSQPPAGSGLITLQPATPVPILGSGPAFSAPQSRQGRLLVGLLAGLVGGVGLALVLYRLNTRLRSREEVEDAFRLPVVAEVPRIPPGGAERDVAVVSQPRSDVADAYRRIRLAIEHMPSHVFPRTFSPSEGEEEFNAGFARRGAHEVTHEVVLVTSPGPAEGKTTTVANLAACFAEAGKTVVVVDGDVHRPELTEVMAPSTGDDAPDRGTPPLEGLVPTLIDGVWLLPANDPRGASMRSVTRRQLVVELRRAVDVVLIDTPPILLSTEAADLASECDTVLLVAKSRRTRAEPAERATELLARLGVPVLGVALIGADEALISGGYRYYYTRSDDAGTTERVSPNGSSNGSGNGHATGNGDVPDAVEDRPSPPGPRPRHPESSP